MLVGQTGDHSLHVRCVLMRDPSVSLLSRQSVMSMTHAERLSGEIAQLFLTDIPSKPPARMASFVTKDHTGSIYDIKPWDTCIL
jgi:hypothetical protein